MKTFIIHVKSQTDRDQNLIKLLQNYKEVTIYTGESPSWVIEPYDRAVLGCSLSHINIINDNIDEESVLVLENDAEIIQDNISHVLNSPIPDNAGIIIMGGDNVPNYDKNPHNNTIYHQIIPPFFGTQAVWYNTNLLKNTSFVLNAYKVMASSKIGKDGICLESILLQALSKTDLKIYRPDKMLYSAIESTSLRTGTILTPTLSTLSIN